MVKAAQKALYFILIYLIFLSHNTFHQYRDELLFPLTHFFFCVFLIMTRFLKIRAAKSIPEFQVIYSIFTLLMHGMIYSVLLLRFLTSFNILIGL